MKFTYDTITLLKEPCSFDKESGKELLQYALGGLLYMPAHRGQIAQEILRKSLPCCSSICLDLEDSIGDLTIREAEDHLYQTLKTLTEAVSGGQILAQDLPLIFIRIRSAQQLRQLFDQYDNELFQIVAGFNFPKFDSATAPAYLQAFDQVQTVSGLDFYFMPILESQPLISKLTRLQELDKIYQLLLPYQDRVLNIRVGATDFSNFYALRRNIDQTIYDIRLISDCLTDIVNVFGQDYVCSGPVWEYFDSQFDEGAWSQGLDQELKLDRLNGFVGKTCIHPSQLAWVAENYIVSQADYHDALAILNMDQNQTGVSKGYQSNRMNEAKPHYRWAQKTLQLALIYGVAE